MTDIRQHPCAACPYRRDVASGVWAGYSLSGYGELSYVDDLSYEVAEAMANNPALTDKDTRIDVLQETLDSIRNDLREPIARLYDIHPDDLP